MPEAPARETIIPLLPQLCLQRHGPSIVMPGYHAVSKLLKLRFCSLTTWLQVEALDFALRKKDEKTALAALESTKSALDTVLAKVL